MKRSFSRGIGAACILAGAVGAPVAAQDTAPVLVEDVNAVVVEGDTRVRGTDDYLDVAAVEGNLAAGGDAFVESLEAMARLLQPPKSPVLLGVGSGVVAPGGTIFASILGTTRRGGVSEELDGAVALGLGLGDAEETVGVQVTSVFSGLEPFGDSGSLALKFSRAIGEATYAAVSFNNVAAWGADDDEPVRTTLAITRFSYFQVDGEFFPVMLTAGYGTHLRDNGTEPGFILGAGIGLTEHVGASISTNTEYVNLGVGVAIEAVDGLNLTATLVDAFDREDRRAGQFALSYAVPNAF